MEGGTPWESQGKGKYIGPDSVCLDHEGPCWWGLKMQSWREGSDIFRNKNAVVARPLGVRERWEALRQGCASILDRILKRNRIKRKRMYNYARGL